MATIPKFHGQGVIIGDDGSKLFEPLNAENDVDTTNG